MRKFFAASVLGAVCVVGFSGCTDGASDDVSTRKVTATTVEKVEEPVVTFSKKAVSSDLTTSDVTVRVKNGTLRKIELAKDRNERSGDDAPVKIKFTEQSEGVYTLTGTLDPLEDDYLLRVTTEDSAGRFKSETVKLKSTVDYESKATLYPYEGVVGVGMPITVQFSAAVDKSHRDRVESVMKATSYPTAQGDWGWLDEGRRAVWRPKSFWKPKSTVRVDLRLAGVQISDEPVIVVENNLNGEFKVGRDFRVTVDDRTKTASAVLDGRTIKTMPVSLGKPGKLTSSGTNIIYEKGNPVRMKGADYDMMVNWAQRYNTTGEYLHSAPWSVGSQGRANVSHGCVNMSPVDARWLYSQTMYGDPVVIKNTGRKADTWDGMGAIWNFSWSEWKKQ